eukprot:CAMPEP_0178727304 /NCGR_PEP_ID=MMETSP0699-20121125/27791_1 /TAXON_ID=265572 /ORGANISM="Extubocellulus spinifer, Strain CCMP396" /LENGTH=78 /DNA_ID=CAMNT_0020379007 /DNA_START=388 /DNA_END=622 /DNA_ORIENTATION=+
MSTTAVPVPVSPIAILSLLLTVREACDTGGDGDDGAAATAAATDEQQQPTERQQQHSSAVSEGSARYRRPADRFSATR